MVTDPPPGNHTLRVEFLKSDRIDSLDLPQDDGLCRLAESIAKALNSEIRRGVRQACADFLSSTAGFYGVRKPQIRVLAARPLRVRESGWGTELGWTPVVRQPAKQGFPIR